ncbi:MAG: leucine-rich repeat domain-containing protein, partial [Pseudomonadota bacterium]
LIGKGKEVDNRPSDETREQWELEAAVSILLGEIIPEARRRHLQEIKLTGYSNSLFAALQAREANLTDLYVDPEADRWPRQIKAKDLSPLSGLSGLQTLDLDGTQVSDLSPLRGLSELRALYLRDTQVSDLAPLRGLSGLQTLDLDGTQVSDLSPLRGLSEFIFLFLDRTQVIDWSPVDHVDDVIGRPHDWPRKSKV